ncbi:MAG: methyl-accepting chemotaxis protein, partial [Phormidium sp.]
AEQATGSEQISQEAERLSRLISHITKAMTEQASAASEITIAVETIRRQTDQTAKAMTEQTRAIKDMTSGTQNISKQIAMITRSNREHSNVASIILKNLGQIRAGSDRHLQEIKQTLQF